MINMRNISRLEHIRVNSGDPQEETVGDSDEEGLKPSRISLSRV